MVRRSSAVAALLALLGLGSLTVSCVSSCSFAVSIEDQVTPPEARMGWAGPAEVEACAPLTAGLPEFFISGGGQDNDKRDVRLWEAVLAVTGGQHLPNYPQQVGDCCEFGAKNAIECLQCVQMKRGPPAAFRPVFPPFQYGYGRVVVGGGRLSGDGSTGGWTALAAQRGGVLASDAPNVPQYSGSVSRAWGRSGPPEWAVAEARQYPVKTVAKVRTAADVRDAICNGYPVTIASNFGTRNFDVRDGRRVARGDGSWAHQMVLLSFDGSAASGERYFYCLNSWGEKAHPAPLQNEPPGGFWMTWGQVERIVSQGDSYAYSGFAGFPAQDLDFHLFGDDGAAHDAAPLVAVASLPTPEPPPPAWQTEGILCGLVLLASAGLLIAGRMTRRFLPLVVVVFAAVAGQASADELDVRLFGSPIAEPPPLAVDLFGDGAAVPPLTVSLFAAPADPGKQLLFFSGKSCPPCKAVKTRTLPPLKAAGWKVGAGEAEQIRVIDGEGRPDLMRRYGVEGYATWVMLEGGREVRRTTGFLDPFEVGRLYAGGADQVSAR